MAIELGFTSVMMDGSLLADGKTPSDYEYNVDVTRQVVEAAHAKGVSVEGELGTLGGIEDGHGSGEVHLTDPDQAVDFVAQTGVDALAVAIGTSHGAYKFTAKPDRRRARDAPDRGDPPEAAGHAHGHARLLQRPARSSSTASTPRAASSRRPSACRSRRSSRASATACARSTSTPTAASRSPRRCARRSTRARPSSTRARSSSRRARPRSRSSSDRLTQFGAAGHAGDYEVLSLDEMAEAYAGSAVGA